MIVADTGAVLALIDADDPHHAPLRELFEARPTAWVLPWVVLPEVDYLVAKYLGAGTEEAFLDDLAAGTFAVEWGQPADLQRAADLAARYSALRLGLVDSVVMATAERLEARAIATLDLRDFGPVELRGEPRLLPRDL